MKSIKTLRKISIAKKILKDFDLYIISIIGIVILIGLESYLISMIPPLKAIIINKLLILLPILFIEVFLKSKFYFDKNALRNPSSLIYMFLYFFVFIGIIDYFPENIKIISAETANYFFLCLLMFSFIYFGTILLNKIMKTYSEYKILIEKGEKYDEIQQKLLSVYKEIMKLREKFPKNCGK
jgi:cell shape-determining protein MreC